MERYWRYILICMVLLAAIYLINYMTNVNPFSARFNNKEVQHLPHYMHLANTSHIKPSSCSKLSNLRKVVLVINYNTPFYASIPLLRQYYGDIFRQIVFCGDTKDDDVVNIDEHRGYFGYECLVRAIEKYPDFDGYFYINDDVLVNWWNLLELDTTKIWLGSRIHFKTGHEIGKPVQDGWHWWKTAHAAKLCEKAFEKIEQMSKTKTGIQLDLPKYMERYFKNTNGRKLCVHNWADVVYIPKDLSKPFALVLRIFRENNVFLEVAIPTALGFFIERAINLNGIYMHSLYGYSPKYLSGETFYETYSVHLSFIHPFKLGGPMKISNYNFLRNVVSVFAENVKYYCTWKRKITNSLN